MSPTSRTSHRVTDLEDARTSHDFVRVVRAIDGADALTGYVVSVGEVWALLKVFDAGYADGWAAVMLDDIEMVEAITAGRFVRRGLEAQNAWPARPPAVQLDLSGGARGLVLSACEYFSLITLHSEREHPGTFEIGRPVCWPPGRLEWQQLNRDAGWDEQLTSYDHSSITRLDVGGRYATALSRVAELRGLR